MRGILFLHIDVKDYVGGKDEGYEGRPQESQYLRFKHPPPPKKILQGFPPVFESWQGEPPDTKAKW